MNPKNDPLNAIFFTPTEEQKRELHRKRAASVILRLDADVRTELQEYIYFEKLSAAERAAKAMQEHCAEIAEDWDWRKSGDSTNSDIAHAIERIAPAAIARRAIGDAS